MTFNIQSYIKNLCEQFAQETGTPAFDFEFTEVSGVNGLEGIISGSPKYDNFVASDATGDGSILQQRNGGYFIRRVATVFIVRKYKYMDMSDMRLKMENCRYWLKRIIRQMVTDETMLKNNLVYLNTERIAFREFAPEVSAHFTGLYFMIDFNQPYDILND